MVNLSMFCDLERMNYVLRMNVLKFNLISRRQDKLITVPDQLEQHTWDITQNSWYLLQHKLQEYTFHFIKRKFNGVYINDVIYFCFSAYKKFVIGKAFTRSSTLAAYLRLSSVVQNLQYCSVGNKRELRQWALNFTPPNRFAFESTTVTSLLFHFSFWCLHHTSLSITRRIWAELLLWNVTIFLKDVQGGIIEWVISSYLIVIEMKCIEYWKLK